MNEDDDKFTITRTLELILTRLAELQQRVTALETEQHGPLDGDLLDDER